MNTRRFVSGSSIILAGWLGATFFNEVPAQRYPKLDKNPAVTAVGEKVDSAAVPVPLHAAVLPVSVSR